MSKINISVYLQKSKKRQISLPQIIRRSDQNFQLQGDTYNQKTPSYNGFFDKNLRGYFNSPKVCTHLQKIGLLPNLNQYSIEEISKVQQINQSQKIIVSDANKSYIGMVEENKLNNKQKPRKLEKDYNERIGLQQLQRVKKAIPKYYTYMKHNKTSQQSLSSSPIQPITKQELQGLISHHLKQQIE